MSLLEEINKRKGKLKMTETVITHADGSIYLENSEMRDLGLEPKKLVDLPKKYGFVEDLKPDNIPAEICTGLFIGSQDCTEVTVLNQYKFTNILSIGVDCTAMLEKKFIPCLDLPETNIHPILIQTNLYINEVLGNDGLILVHCNAGVSRSAMVVIGYLILEKKYSFNDAYNIVKLQRPCIQPNTGFIKQLKKL